jgi:hypothetical protein
VFGVAAMMPKAAPAVGVVSALLNFAIATLAAAPEALKPATQTSVPFQATAEGLLPMN